ncbi:hypothetical protein RRG08_030874 [Elysia crispata]|uniref:Uncharacterized protein n=1 Tax=Elysia crispata TaxID=231223 RepID=A0AAE1CLG5_9GAST|nr:hypothetical protein RRG08_030874 [Elysia crispata]
MGKDLDILQAVKDNDLAGLTKLLQKASKQGKNSILIARPVKAAGSGWRGSWSTHLPHGAVRLVLPEVRLRYFWEKFIPTYSYRSTVRMMFQHYRLVERDDACERERNLPTHSVAYRETLRPESVSAAPLALRTGTERGRVFIECVCVCVYNTHHSTTLRIMTNRNDVDVSGQ